MGGDCGPEAPCSRSLAAMERAHRHALEELQRQHDRQMRELEKEKERLLLEETRDTARGRSLGQDASKRTLPCSLRPLTVLKVYLDDI